MRRALLLVSVSCVLVACGGGDDAARDASLDAPATDAPSGDGHADALCMDADSDGHGAMSCGGDDCDDADPRRYPGNTELCDGIDQDCDPATLGPDGDGDGQPSDACCNPVAGGPPICGTDCDDTRATVNATALETCNGADDNCDGRIDEGVPMLTCFDDSDSDSYALAGATSHMACACTSTQTTRPPVGSDVDCNDANAAVHPTAVDICDALDNDCDGTPDNGAGASYYADCDVDTFGDPAVTHAGCSTPTVPTPCPGGVWRADPSDCDDTRATVHPGAAESCNGRDDDCNGTLDDVAPSVVASDTANCGACGHACLHAGCGSAICTNDFVEVGFDDSGAQTCARRGGGAVQCWGDNASGNRLGVGGAAGNVLMPTAVPGLTDATVLASYGKCAIRTGGHVSCWGDRNSSGAGGLATVDVPGARLLLGSRSTSGVTSPGVYVVAGDTLSAYDPTSPATPAVGIVGAGMADVTELMGCGADLNYFCFVHAAGTVQCTRPLAGTIFTVGGVTDAVALGCDGSDWLVVRATGEVYAFPIGGTAATPWTTGVTTATDVADGYVMLRDHSLLYRGTSLSDSDVVRVFGSVLYSEGPMWENRICVLRSSSRVACSGTNYFGEVGDGTTTSPSFLANVIDP